MKGRSSPDLASIRPVPLLALGFAISALATYATAFVLGGAVLGGVRAGAIAKWAAAGALAIFIAVDAGALGLHTPMWRRQTPRGLFLQYGAAKGAFLWGLDSGLVVTTFRVTSLSWAALTVTLLGLVPWWSGLAYALGFAVPTAMLVLAVPVRSDTARRVRQDPVWLLEKIGEAEPIVRRVALLVLAGGSMGCLAAALGRF